LDHASTIVKNGKIMKKLIVAALGATMTMGIVMSSPAAAHKYHYKPWHGFKVVIGDPGYGYGYYGSGCRYPYWKWQDTGAYYWKKQYFMCRGWW